MQKNVNNIWFCTSWNLRNYCWDCNENCHTAYSTVLAPPNYNAEIGYGKLPKAFKTSKFIADLKSNKESEELKLLPNSYFQ